MATVSKASTSLSKVVFSVMPTGDFPLTVPTDLAHDNDAFREWQEQNRDFLEAAVLRFLSLTVIELRPIVIDGERTPEPRSSIDLFMGMRD